MKICPTCNQTYSDESLNFCLNDGGALNPVDDENLSQQTVIMGQAPATNPKTVFTNQPVSQPNWGISQAAAVQPPKKKSKAWLWILGIVGLLVIFGGIGLVGLIGLVAISNSDETPENKGPKNTPNKLDSVTKDDFSKWGNFSNKDGSGEFSNGEYKLQSKQVRFFYVLITPNKNFKTSNSTTTVTARNSNGVETETGYGLIIHSDPDNALSKDYAFLIDSAKQSYRIVKHLDNKETIEVSWTRFPAIRSGTQTNEIQVKDENGKMSFFINGQFVTSITDSIGYKDGVVGIYAGDGIPIAFSNLQIGK